jgi:hypothetical protein
MIINVGMLTRRCLDSQCLIEEKATQNIGPACGTSRPRLGDKALSNPCSMLNDNLAK